MKIFLTGGNGMVGRNIRFMADNLGYEVISPTRLELDLHDKDKLVKYLQKIKPDLVIHSAGLVGGIQANINSPFNFCYENLQIGLNVVAATMQADITKLINLGSSCMYPRLASNPLKEEQVLTGELEPTNEGYAVAKIAIARLTEYASKQFGYIYKTLIPCNLYGYWDNFDPIKSHMIPAAIRKVHLAKANNQKSVDIWGDGTARREFLFAQDLADFIFYIIKNNKIDINSPSLINVGLGRDYTINEFYEAIKDVVGYPGGFAHDLSKPAGMKQKQVDVSIQRDMGWNPPKDLHQGIELTYKFFLDNYVESKTV